MTEDHPPGEHAVYQFEGKGYVIACTPELWPMLHLPAVHPWARSVRWSCGRPGFEMPTKLFADEVGFGSSPSMLEMRMAAGFGLSVTVPGGGFGPITAT